VSIQSDINYVKSELSADEKVLESALKIETLYKKNKVLIWGVVVAAIVAFAGKSVAQSFEDQKLLEANQAYLTLQKDSKDSAALGVLKEKNPALYELYTYSQAVRNGDKQTLAALSKSSNEIIADMSRYHSAIAENKSVDSKYYADMANITEAYEAIKNADINKAKEKLDMIGEQSPLATTATLLRHYTIKGK